MFQLTHFHLFFLIPLSRSCMSDVSRRLSPLFPPLRTRTMEMVKITRQVRRNSRKMDEVKEKPSTRKKVKYIARYTSTLLLAKGLQKKTLVSKFLFPISSKLSPECHPRWVGGQCSYRRATTHSLLHHHKSARRCQHLS